MAANGLSGLRWWQALPAVAILVGSLALAESVFLESRSASGEPPGYHVPTTRYDFGVVRGGERLEVRLPIENTGGRRLIVRRAGSSCDCLAAEATSLIVPPGERDELLATLDTGKLRGGVQIEIEYVTNAPGRPRFRVQLLADVRP